MEDSVLRQIPLPLFQTMPDPLLWAIRGALVMLLAWAVGRIIRRVAAPALAQLNFDAMWKTPWLREPARLLDEPKAKMSPSETAGLCIELTAVAGGLWMLARLHNLADIALVIQSVLKLAWILGLLVVVVACVGRLLAAPVVHALEADAIRRALDGPAVSTHRDQRSLADSLIPVAGAAVYILVAALVFLAGADILQWSALQTALAGVWQLGLRVAAAALILLVAWTAVRWIGAESRVPDLPTLPGEARSLALPSPDAAEPLPGRLPADLKLAFIIVACLLAIGALHETVVRSFAGWVLVAAVAIFLITFHGYLPDIGAGLYLVMRQVKRATIGGVPSRLVKRGLVCSDWMRSSEVVRCRNKQILDAVLSPSAHSPASAIDPPGEGKDSGATSPDRRDSKAD